MDDRELHPRLAPGISSTRYEDTLDLLENFMVIGQGTNLALVHGGPYREHLHQNVRAAVVASGAGLRSVDYARKKYCSDDLDYEQMAQAPSAAYDRAYRAAKTYLSRMRGKLIVDRCEPDLGTYGASVVLLRLTHSFSAAHILFRMGHRYEGHAVARLILEQIAWSYSAHSKSTIAEIAKIVTTATIGELKRLVPWVGRFYGELSRKTHIDYKSHREFAKWREDRSWVLLTQHEFAEFARTILQLADLFGIVWECSQREHMDKLEAVELLGNTYSVNQDRPFLSVLRNEVAAVEAAVGYRETEAADRQSRVSDAPPTVED